MGIRLSNLAVAVPATESAERSKGLIISRGCAKELLNNPALAPNSCVGADLMNHYLTFTRIDWYFFTSLGVMDTVYLLKVMIF